jgi:hypothetical protein
MKKTIICNIPMKEIVDQSVYVSNDLSIPVSSRAVRYPINAMLEETLSAEDEIKILLLLKKDEVGHYEKNKTDFEEELLKVNERCGAQFNIEVLDTDFSQDKSVHEQLMGRIVDEIDNDSHILVDITYGPKDLPIVIFAALGFAEKFLNCEIDGIIYGQASFVDGHAVNTKVCDMSPLYYLSSVTNTINCDGPDKARKTLKSLLSL